MHHYWLVAGTIWCLLLLALWPRMRSGGLILGGAVFGAYGAVIAGIAGSHTFLGGWRGFGAAIWLTPVCLLVGGIGGGWLVWAMLKRAPRSGGAAASDSGMD